MKRFPFFFMPKGATGSKLHLKIAPLRLAPKFKFLTYICVYLIVSWRVLSTYVHKRLYIPFSSFRSSFLYLA